VHRKNTAASRNSQQSR